MLDVIEIQEPVLINTIGHAVALMLFSGFLVLVLRDRRRTPDKLAVTTATLALLWNAGSLAALAATTGLISMPDTVAALSFSVLSLLPGVLLQLSLNGRARPVWILGYVVSSFAIGLHLAELIWPDSRLHQAALWTIVFGFGALTASAMFLARRSPVREGRSGRRIAASMCLFLFAISFVHFSPGHVRSAWSSEIALHHAGIPLALFVLLQDYRFLLLDAFVRFAANGMIASAFLALMWSFHARFHALSQPGANPFVQGVLVVAACLFVVALLFLRGKLHMLLTRVAFGRRDRETATRAIREAGGQAVSEAGFLQDALAVVAAFMRASQSEIRQLAWDDARLPLEPLIVPDAGLLGSALGQGREWAEAVVPVRFTKGDGVLLLLGRRDGGRRYLSEDLQELSSLAGVILEQIERLRNSEIQRLVSQAELRALQSQINPHFLFNSLNTLYGTIPRQAAAARRMVLNLAEIFRYFLQSERPYISVADEAQIVSAYLQIESLRLGDRLKIEIDVAEAAQRALIPVLSIQPLVENAVKHGVASRSGVGAVRVSARVVGDSIRIEVSDNGAGFPPPELRGLDGGTGVGLENVQQRLLLHFGESARLEIESSEKGSTVGFVVPARWTFQAPGRVSAQAKGEPADALHRPA